MAFRLTHLRNRDRFPGGRSSRLRRLTGTRARFDGAAGIPGSPGASARIRHASTFPRSPRRPPSLNPEACFVAASNTTALPQTLCKAGALGRSARPRTALLLLLLAASVARPVPVSGGIYDLQGLGARAVALGGAYTALADDFTSVYYNPAGLSGDPESSMTLGGVWAKPYFYYREAGGPDQVPKLYAVGGAYFGVATNLAHLTGYDQLAPWTLGISLYMPLERALLADIPSTGSHRSFLLYRDQSQVMSILLGLSWKILDWLSVGISGNFLADLHAPNEAFVDVDIRTVVPYLLQVGDLVKEVRPRIKRSARMKVAPVLGVLVHPTDRLRLGVTYRGKFYAETIGTQDIELRFRDFSAGPSSPTIRSTVLADIHYVHFWNPHQVSMGAAFAPLKSFWVALDLTWADWSDYLDPLWTRPEPRFRDTFTPRLGLEYTLQNGIVLRGGYFFQPSPVPEQTREANYLDNDKHVVSAGVGYTFPRLPWIPIWKKPLTVDGFFQYTQLVTRTYHKEPGFGDSLGMGGYMLYAGASLQLHY